MSEEQFTKLLRHYTQHKPFFPFVVELNDGQRLLITTPAVAFAGGAAGFIDDTDGALVDFTCDRVVTIAPAHAEAAP